MASGITFQVENLADVVSKARVLLRGIPGAGKTGSSLLMALGMASSPDKIMLYDTERGSAAKSAKSGIIPIEVLKHVKSVKLTPPFMIEKFIEAIKFAEKQGIEVAIIDSLTHLWTGEGGALDEHQKITEASRSKNSWNAWGKITPRLERFLDTMIGSDLHVICTSRVKTVYDKNDDGQYKKSGEATKLREDFEFEFDAVLDMNSNDHVAHVLKDRAGIFGINKFFTPTSDIGKAVAEHLASGVAIIDPLTLRRQIADACRKYEVNSPEVNLFNAVGVKSTKDIPDDQLKAALEKTKKHIQEKMNGSV